MYSQWCVLNRISNPVRYTTTYNHKARVEILVKMMVRKMMNKTRTKLLLNALQLATSMDHLQSFE
ncbi:hypothetical protein HanPSC8_Chr02g0051771 [Helianthus annuus]|nr:hypothetical protein HanPSC8_Chr02g0051771 [Helianthus annuus]